MKKANQIVGHFNALFVNPSLVPKVNLIDILQQFMTKTRHMAVPYVSKS